MLKANNGIRFAQDVAMNHVRDKGKPLCKLSYKIFKDQDGYDTLPIIYLFSTLI